MMEVTVMNNMVFHPGLILIATGFIAAIVPKNVRKFILAGGPLVALAAMFSLSYGTEWVVPFINGIDLHLVLPASDYEGINVEAVREAAGRAMGREDATGSDCVCGIPDSGVGHALGYAEGRGVPYQRAVLKYTPTWPRSFTPGQQSRRALVAKMKLIPNRAILDGKRVVFCDDSIVRGTQLRDNVQTFYDCGAREVHARISCPPLVFGCPFVGFTSSKNDLELITRQIIRDFEGDDAAKLDRYSTTGTPEYERMVNEIARRLNLTTLQFSKIEHLIDSIGLPICRVCTHCFDGSGCHPDVAYREDHPDND